MVLGKLDWYMWKNEIRMLPNTKHNLQIQRDPYQITKDIFHRTGTKNPSIHMKTQIAKAVLRKKNGAGGNQSSWLQMILQSYSHQDSMVLAQKQKYRPMKQDREPEISSCIYGYLIFDKGGKNRQWAKTASSINGAGKTGQLHVKEWN